MSFFVYGVMRTVDVPGAIAGHDADAQLPPVETVNRGGLCALVSEANGAAPRLTRKRVFAHAEVLRCALEHGPVLPLRVGTVIADRETIERDLLAARRTDLAARLDGVAGRAEFQLKVSYLERPLLAGIVAANPAIAHAARRIRGLAAGATHFERIHLGELLAHAVQARREADAGALIGALAPHAAAVAVAEPTQEHTVLNAAFLVDDTARAEFDDAVEEASHRHAAEMRFRLLGPLPAYSFADHDALQGALAWA